MFFVRMTTPPFDALYALPPSVPSIPSMLAMLTIEPALAHRVRLLLEHQREGGLVGEERALEVDVEDAVPLAAVDHVDRSPAGDTRRVHERVEATVLRVGGVDRGGHRGLVADVELDDAVAGRDVGADDGRTLLREALRRRGTDAGRRARDHRDLAVE